MTLTRADFGAVVEADLLELIEVGTSEGLDIDYKRELYPSTTEGKRELLKDVSAFANAIGGHLVLGIEEHEGAPTDILGCSGDLDAQVQWMEQVLRTSIEPPIIGLWVRAIPISRPGRSAVVVRIPPSWNRPHRVTFRGSRRFWIRNSSGAHEASMEELRNLFTMAESAVERARAFREQRIAALAAARISGEKGRGYMALHIVPLAGSPQIDLVAALEDEPAAFVPIGGGGSGARFNFEGLLFSDEPDGSPLRYTQLYRSGALEVVRRPIARPMENGTGKSLSYRIAGSTLERQFFEALPRYLSGLSRLGVNPPLAILTTLGKVKDALYDVYVPTGGRRHPPFEHDVLPLPECVLNSYGPEGTYQACVRPAFDALWNAAGLSHDSFFRDGVWIDPETGLRPRR